MKKRIAFLLAVPAVLAAATALADMPRRGAAVFADGFDQPGTFAENWGKPHGKVKSEDGRMVANAIGTVTQASAAASLPTPPATRRRSPSYWQWCRERCRRGEA